MNVEYVGTVKSVVPSFGSAAVEHGTVLTGLSEAEAAALLMVPALWKAADAEAEAVVPAFPAAFAMDTGGLDPFSAEAVYTGGVTREEGGLYYRARYASHGETPRLAVHVWEQLAPVPAGYKPGGASSANSLLGAGALDAVTEGEGNVVLGDGAGEDLTSGKFNTLLGRQAGHDMLTSVQNTFVGAGAGRENAGNENTFLGSAAGGENNGSGNVFIGAEAGEGTMGSNKLLIANNRGTPIVAGVMSETAASQEIGFLGAVPVKRAAHPTTLADVITILQGLGFCE